MTRPSLGRRRLALAAVSALAVGWCAACSSSPGPVPSPAAPETAVLSPPAGAASGSEAPGTPTASVSAVPQSPPVRLVQPDVGLDVAVKKLPASRSNPIDPPTLADAYWDPAPVPPIAQHQSFGLGSSTPDLTVLAGHTPNKVPEAALNPLYDWRAQRATITEGQALWVQTQASGSAWLVYRLVKIHFPAKGDGPDSLARSTEVWGTAAHPKPNHLLVIGCQQHAVVGERSTNNIVWEFVFDRVSVTPPA